MNTVTFSDIVLYFSIYSCIGCICETIYCSIPAPQIGKPGLSPWITADLRLRRLDHPAGSGTAIESLGNPGSTIIDINGPAEIALQHGIPLIVDNTGATVSSFHSFLFIQGLETLSLQVERYVQNALAVVEFLTKPPAVEAVNHPSLPGHPNHGLYKAYFLGGGGSILSFEIKGAAEKARAFID